MKFFTGALIFLAVAIGKAASDTTPAPSRFPSKKPHLAPRLVVPHERPSPDRTTHKPTSITLAPSPGSLGGSIKKTASPSTPIAPVPTSPTLPGHVGVQDSPPDHHRGPHAPQAPRTVQPTLNENIQTPPVQLTPKPDNARRAPRFRPTPPTQRPIPLPTQMPTEMPTCVGAGQQCSSPRDCCSSYPCVSDGDGDAHCLYDNDSE